MKRGIVTAGLFALSVGLFVTVAGLSTHSAYAQKGGTTTDVPIEWKWDTGSPKAESIPNSNPALYKLTAKGRVIFESGSAVPNAQGSRFWLQYAYKGSPNAFSTTDEKYAVTIGERQVLKESGKADRYYFEVTAVFKDAEGADAKFAADFIYKLTPYISHAPHDQAQPTLQQLDPPGYTSIP